jgi:hypothetical protein
MATGTTSHAERQPVQRELCVPSRDGRRACALLAQFDDGKLLVQDGNHRYEALTREGATHTWVLLWFDDPDDHREFRDRVRAFVA